ncbi:hypothetical protein [Pseudaminobacter soli (ex Li et al. 2025)]|uniref:Uncharacterized protein n=1 Tax=Pseudaminobacter soli (ex Li et al. 2025) TaxID=1295366 RepID=A0A2P7RNC1_9HYPH|nr:hypothetical protein [Mesorhizobium soli]PSJ51727.1 hypothetical protein C7I85_29375 [Mesorhizobium soli]
MFGCYSAVLTQALEDLGHADALARMPAVPLFLEIGACDRTMISLMSLGLSRVAAMRFAVSVPSQNLDMASAINWLRDADLEKGVLTWSAMPGPLNKSQNHTRREEMPRRPN